ncbi:MAG: dTMP kinase [Alphaproteobacteria bacterium]|jgi:dTMP kinase|nr:dTMP kinase [Alphaproteobacteria bacterium]
MSKTKQAIFLCLEGGEAVGKSNQIKFLEKLFEQNNLSCLKTREPGGIKVAEEIRNLIFSNNIEATTELLLFNASRHENIKQMIIPNFENYDVILVDRFLLSTIVYQGVLGNIPIDDIIYLHEKFNFNLYPDLTIVLDDSIDRVMKRLEKRKEFLQNRMDKINDRKYHETILQSFKSPTSFYRGNLEIIEGSDKSLLEVHKSIVSLINKYFNMNLKPLDKLS